jgi:hypothetical protein
MLCNPSQKTAAKRAGDPVYKFNPENLRSMPQFLGSVKDISYPSRPFPIMITEGRGEEYRRECLAAIGITTTRDTGKWELIGINATKEEIDKILEEIEKNQ